MHSPTREHTKICNTYCFPRPKWLRERASMLHYTYILEMRAALTRRGKGEYQTKQVDDEMRMSNKNAKEKRQMISQWKLTRMGTDRHKVTSQHTHTKSKSTWQSTRAHLMACGYQICLHSGAPAPAFRFKRLNLKINFHNTRFLPNSKQCAAITKKSTAHFSYGSTRSFLLDSCKPLNTKREQHFLMVKHVVCTQITVNQPYKT